MHHSYQPRGVCSTKIDFDIENGTLHNVVFQNGCEGNLKAIGLLIEGKNAAEVAALLRGNACGFKSTSCADQLALAIGQVVQPR